MTSTLAVATDRNTSTNAKLTALGYTSETRANYRKAIFKDGSEVFEGTCHEVNAWLVSSAR